MIARAAGRPGGSHGRNIARAANNICFETKTRPPVMCVAASDWLLAREKDVAAQHASLNRQKAQRPSPAG